MSVAAQGIGRQSFLLVFDFDHTLVDCNSDVAVPQLLGKLQELERLQKQRVEAQKSAGESGGPFLGEHGVFQWTNMMNALLSGFTKDELCNAAREAVTFSPAVKKLFELLTKLQQCRGTLADEIGARTALQDNGDESFLAREAPFIDIAIASDANELFIEEVLKSQVPFAVKSINHICSNTVCDVANSAGDGSGPKVHIGWHESAGHQCRLCNAAGRPNICKTRIIQRILQRTKLIDPTIVFVGDGENDYCPCVNLLRPRDIMLPRRGYGIHKALSRKSMPAAGCCRYVLWRTGEELLAAVERVLLSAPRLPTLARFRDVAPTEFRSITLAGRIPSIFARILEANKAIADIDEISTEAINRLTEGIRQNDFVPPLPGETTLPNWLYNYGLVGEYDDPAHSKLSARKKAPNESGPRWGQLPWLAGEIYMYHLLWEYMMKAPGVPEQRTASAYDPRGMPNIISPYAILPPLIAQESALTRVLGAIEGTDFTHASINKGTFPAEQEFHAAFLAAEAVDLGQPVGSCQSITEGGRAYRACLPTGYFAAYRDIFSPEKEEVVTAFIASRVIPMVVCKPWEHGEMLDVILRWMFWGNGVDLSMFSPEQLREGNAPQGGGGKHLDKHGSGETPAAREESLLRRCRDSERQAAVAQDSRIVGNDLEAAVAYVRQLVCEREIRARCGGTACIDVVMDNVGVEQVADLLFALWVLEADPDQTSMVTFHVKPMPYYVSDTTPRDFDILLTRLDDYIAKSLAPESHLERKGLTSFITRVRHGFSVSGRLRVATDPAWVQPSEYRELPPALLNTFFFRQRLKTEEELQLQSPSEASMPQVEKVGESMWRQDKVVQPATGMVFFKGDLNFRRLLGDRFWDQHAFLAAISAATSLPPHVKDLLMDTTTNEAGDAPSFRDIVASFWPVAEVPVCTVRTIKSECCIGVSRRQQEALDVADRKWRMSGAYGVILFAGAP